MLRSRIAVGLSAIAPLLLGFLATATPGAAGQAPAIQTEPVAEPTCAAATLLVNAVHDHGVDFARLAELTGAFPVRPRLLGQPHQEWRVDYCAPSVPTPWDARLRSGRRNGTATAELLPFALNTRYNSAYPRGGNDGILWAGRGVGVLVHGGVLASLGPVTASFAPAAAWQQNQPFDYLPLAAPRHGPFTYLTTIDLPFRHGDAAFWTIDPGQSHLAVHGLGAEAGITAGNMWWGPGRRNSLLMTSSAAGVPRVFIGTDRPADLRIGTFEANLFWGRTQESAWFDNDPDNDRNLLAGAIVAFTPRFLPELHVGAARMYLGKWPAGTGAADMLLRPYRGVRRNEQAGDFADNNLLALYLRWALPAAGFEAYAEWGREDHWADWLDILAEPDHSQGYVLGFQKVAPIGTRWLRIAGELTHLHSSAPHRGGRGTGGWYTHSTIMQGYTHRGQMLGAAIGPGADAQFLGADLFDRSGRTGVGVERIRYNEDLYYTRWARLYGMHGHDVELNVMASRDHAWRDLELRAELAHSFRRNRNFIGLETGSWDLRRERNLGARLDLVWRPRGGAQNR